MSSRGKNQFKNAVKYIDSLPQSKDHGMKKPAYAGLISLKPDGHATPVTRAGLK